MGMGRRPHCAGRAAVDGIARFRLGWDQANPFPRSTRCARDITPVSPRHGTPSLKQAFEGRKHHSKGKNHRILQQISPEYKGLPWSDPSPHPVRSPGDPGPASDAPARCHVLNDSDNAVSASRKPSMNRSNSLSLRISGGSMRNAVFRLLTMNPRLNSSA